MRSLAILSVLAGCSFRPNPAGAGSGDAGLDASTDAGGDVAIDAPPGVTDTDGDGVPDSLDNCPAIANADQRDHDVDGRGDVCDLCPHIAEATDVDSDGDGVGDACDPRPTTAGDTRVLWAGFYDASEIAGWVSNATFTVSMGRLTGGDVGTALAYIYPPTAYQRTFAQTSVRANTLATSGMNVSPGGLLFTGDGGAQQYYLCDVAATMNGNQVVALDTYPTNQSHLDNQPWTGTWGAGSEVMLTDQVVGSTHTCVATQGATRVPVTQNAGTTMGVTVLGSAYANVSFDYLFVVAIGP